MYKTLPQMSMNGNTSSGDASVDPRNSQAASHMVRSDWSYDTGMSYRLAGT